MLVLRRCHLISSCLYITFTEVFFRSFTFFIFIFFNYMSVTKKFSDCFRPGVSEVSLSLELRSVCSGWRELQVSFGSHCQN